MKVCQALVPCGSVDASDRRGRRSSRRASAAPVGLAPAGERFAGIGEDLRARRAQGALEGPAEAARLHANGAAPPLGVQRADEFEHWGAGERAECDGFAEPELDGDTGAGFFSIGAEAHEARPARLVHAGEMARQALAQGREAVQDVVGFGVDVVCFHRYILCAKATPFCHSSRSADARFVLHPSNGSGPPCSLLPPPSPPATSPRRSRRPSAVSELVVVRRRSRILRMKPASIAAFLGALACSGCVIMPVTTVVSPRVTGTVRDAQSKEPIRGALLTAQRAGFHTRTRSDRSGKYSVSPLTQFHYLVYLGSPGLFPTPLRFRADASRPFILSASAPGYRPASLSYAPDEHFPVPSLPTLPSVIQFSLQPAMPERSASTSGSAQTQEQ